jgi:hypothetical protein
MDQRTRVVVGLEGAEQGKRLDTTQTQHQLMITSNPDVAFDVLSSLMIQGELSAAEFIATLTPIPVVGLERMDLYSRELLNTTNNPEAEYLLRIGAASLGDAEATQLAHAGHPKETWQRILAADPWVEGQWNALKAPEQQVERPRSRQIYIDPTIDQDFQTQLDFFQVADQRSRAMANNMVSVAKSAPSALAVLLVGAAHVSGVRAALQQVGYGWVTVQPRRIESPKWDMTADQFQRKLHGKWAARSASSLGSQLNVCKKPPPVLAGIQGQALAATHYIAEVYAHAVRDGGNLNDVARSLPPELANRIVSVEVDGGDVVIAAKVETSRDKRVNVYLRAHAESTMERLKGKHDLAEKISLLLAELAPEKPQAPQSKYGEHVVHVGDTSVVFGATKEDVASFAQHEGKRTICSIAQRLRLASLH